jgi:uncharacterized protein
MGPSQKDIHITCRRNKAGQDAFKQVLRGWEHLRKHGVDLNISCTVNAANQHHGRRVHRFFTQTRPTMR